jgi:hypothetical protein
MINEITVWDLPNTKLVPDGYDVTTVPDVSAANIKFLMDKVNELIQVINKLTPAEEDNG